MLISFKENEVAFLCGKSGTLAIAKTLGKYFYVDSQNDEIILFTEYDDILVASAYGIGEKIRRGLRCTLFQIRELGAPLIVLPKGHHASPRLTNVISIGPRIRLSCQIKPGTHPEQDILCGIDEFHGMVILGKPEGAETEGFSGDIMAEKL
jgi:hypothetical protein